MPKGEEEVQLLRNQVKTECTGRTRRPRRSPLATVETQVVSHWEATRRVRSLQRFNGELSSAFVSFKLACSAQKSCRALKKRCRARKREQLLQGRQEVSHALRQGDSKICYGLIRTIAPKQYLPHIKFRSPGGDMLSVTDEGEMLRKHAQKFFTGGALAPPELLAVPDEVFDAQNWAMALRASKNHKAVPNGEAQIGAWKQNLKRTSERLSEISKALMCSAKPWIPGLWCRVQIAWLPKPNKTPSCPEHLRTVGLVSGDAKTFMHLLKTAAQEAVFWSLRSVPQFAYGAGTSAGDAILRVSEDGCKVRSTLESTNTSNLAKLMGDHQPELRGGLMVAIDLSKAFDNVKHEEIYLSFKLSEELSS